jgi:hypothetical protein
LPGPVLGPPTVTPFGVTFSWPHLNGASYTVSSSEDGVVNAAPITPAVYPFTVNFAHSAPLYRHLTYVYTVTAQYGGGCGVSQLSFVPPAPFVPVAQAYISAAWPNLGQWEVTLAWWVPQTYDNGFGDNTGFLVLGPGLPTDGHQEPGCGTNSGQTCRYAPEFRKTVRVGPGEHTWVIAPYWDTFNNGRMIDVSAGARVTKRVP